MNIFPHAYSQRKHHRSQKTRVSIKLSPDKLREKPSRLNDYRSTRFSTLVRCSLVRCTLVRCTLVRCTLVRYLLVRCTLVCCILVSCTLVCCTLVRCTLVRCTLVRCILVRCTLVRCTLVRCTLVQCILVRCILGLNWPLVFRHRRKAELFQVFPRACDVAVYLSLHGVCERIECKRLVFTFGETGELGTQALEALLEFCWSYVGKRGEGEQLPKLPDRVLRENKNERVETPLLHFQVTSSGYDRQTGGFVDNRVLSQILLALVL